MLRVLENPLRCAYLQGPSRAESSYWIKECHTFFWALLCVTNLVPELRNWLVGLCLDTRQLASFDVSCSGAIAFYMFVPCGNAFGFQKFKMKKILLHQSWVQTSWESKRWLLFSSTRVWKIQPGPQRASSGWSSGRPHEI